jgi:hypothetical protein
MTIYCGRKATALAIMSRTKKIVILVLALAVAFPGRAAAQGPAGNIAYDVCYYSEWVRDFVCYVGLLAVGFRVEGTHQAFTNQVIS